MCLVPDPPKPQMVDSTDARAAQAADAVASRRRNAQGYTASILGGASDTGPSIARQVLGMG